jgi:APA family basic amino acid/polyamine antiporter
MGLWIGGGAFVLLSTLVVAELIAITPKSGGPYVLIAHAFGRYPGFLLGWTDWLSICATGALKAVVLIEYSALLMPGLTPWVTPLAVLVSSGFALFQLGGVRLAVSVSLTFGDAGAAGTEVARMTSDSSLTWAHYGIVAAAIVFTYDGWLSASYYGAEVEGGGRAAAVGSLKGVLIVIALYLLLNGLLVANVPLAVLDGQELAIGSALEYLYGEGTGAFILGTAILILLAHQNIQYMAASRTLYALSVDGLGSRRATGVSERGTPTGALLLSWLLMVSLILAGGFEFLLNLSALLFMVLYVALVAGVIRMRKTAPSLERPYRAWGFPVTAWICLAGWMAIAIFVALMDPESAVYSLGLVLLSVPVFLWLRRRRSRGG